ncbi:hypothetical protein SAMN05216184_11014 [Georgenia satyanarayanai]|uniref:Uncharacterized protein n=1 Tax=Georgenia satyanarayanai TaxID=860221 RepID=A0A2Y9AKM6_9MICO|nr:hypothetical protein [Georgenia satyanarayanai]PYF98877.1 hypothetical protein A8987_11014 [Georgenia satyanarayanai]SSA44725.1 hypothetical protein SAMN05216184_11014 [Georgenia satyanarayanai]
MVTTVLPQWLWGGEPLEFLKIAGLRARDGGQGLRIQTEEAYLRRRRASLVNEAEVIDWRGRKQAGFHSLADVADPKLEEPILRELMESGLVPERVEPIDLPTFLQLLRLDLTLARADGLPAACEAAVANLRDPAVSSGYVEAIPHAAVHTISRSRRLVHRVKLISVLVRLRHDERLAAGDVSEALADHESGRRIFSSSGGLGDGVYGMDAYIAPLMAAISPAVWGFTVTRMHGTLIVSFGQHLPGTAPVPNELLRMLSSVGPDAPTALRPFGSPEVPAAAISWWAERLDALFAVLTDPQVFEGPGGEYEPIAALQNLLSVEQVFRRVNSILLAHHDTHARRPAFFTVMDTLTTLNRWILSKMADYDHAQAVLRKLQSSIPQAAQELLLPAARRGVEALRKLQDGFFLREADGKVRLRQDGTAMGIVPATAKYVDMLRDATHGFTTVRGGAAQRSEVSRMVAIHDGAVPHDLGLLGWLYLLDVLDNPERLRRILSADVRR